MSAIYYDIKGNVTFISEITDFGTLRVTENTYTFTDKPLTSKMTESDGVTMLTENSYDTTSGLLVATDITVNGVKQRVSKVSYDDLGRIVSVARGNVLNSGGTVSYTYNLHGQTKSITGPGFSQTLLYTDGPGKALFNGNVSSMLWKMGNDVAMRGYKYSYNGYNWLTQAEYGEGTSLSANKNRYTEKFQTFMRNGGICRMGRYGLMVDGDYGLVDDLHIQYDGNRISRIVEDADDVTQAGSMDFQGKPGGADFEYDACGSLIKDESRDIKSIEYDNHGNPTKISFTDGPYTSNVYSSMGTKLKTVHFLLKSMVVNPDPLPVTHDSGLMATNAGGTVPGLAPGGGVFEPVSYMERFEYRGPVIYRNGKVDMVLFPGGYASIDKDNAVTFHYYTQDYLGNNRAVVNGTTGAVEQTIAYYPYGGVIPDLGTGINLQPYKFGGKELVCVNGINEYDYGARRYWSSAPCFTSVDPRSEKYYWLSPFLFCASNPINFIDIKGNDVWNINSKGYLVGVESNKNIDMIVINDNNSQNYCWVSNYGAVKPNFSSGSQSSNTMSSIEIRGESASSSLFEFVAVNTSVEWMLINTSEAGNNNSNFIISTHEENTISGVMSFVNENIGFSNIEGDIHSHPGNTEYPSGLDPEKPGDIQFAKEIDKLAGKKLDHKIFIPKTRSYIDYNQNSTLYEYNDFFNQLQEITITVPPLYQ